MLIFHWSRTPFTGPCKRSLQLARQCPGKEKFLALAPPYPPPQDLSVQKHWKNVFSADLLMRISQVIDNWVTWYLYYPVNTVLDLLTSLPALLLTWLLIPAAKDPSQNSPSCHTHTHTPSCLSPVSVPGAAIGPALVNLSVCTESCWEDRLSHRAQHLACIMLHQRILALKISIQKAGKAPGVLVGGLWTNFPLPLTKERMFMH